MLNNRAVKSLKPNEWENEYVFRNLYPRNPFNSLPVLTPKRGNGVIRQKRIKIYQKSEKSASFQANLNYIKLII
jgi:hypothetical protein